MNKDTRQKMKKEGFCLNHYRSSCMQHDYETGTCLICSPKTSKKVADE